MNSKITLVGAGPGAVDLLTIRGLRAIEAAEVILYDALVSVEMLDFARPNCELIYVGKRLGDHSKTQDEINHLLVNLASKYKSIVRLKGGDPIVFGRATEELDYVSKYGIETEVISGISSCIAVPTSLGIPVTRRGLAESFWVLTGHTKEKGLPKDIFLAAKSNATVVILMGMSKLKEIVEVYCNQSRSNYPIAIIQNGTTSNCKYVIGKIGDIQSRVLSENLSQPSVIVIGEVVSLHTQYIKEYGDVLLTSL